MKNRIIINSEDFGHRLDLMRFRFPYLNSPSTVKMVVKDKYISFADQKFEPQCCEASNDFEFDLELKRLDNLISVLKVLSLQPISLHFDESSSWVFIKEAIL